MFTRPSHTSANNRITGRRLRYAASGIAAAAAILALPLASANAAPAFADTSATQTTADGWQVVAGKTGEHIRSVLPLNQSPWTHEGFLSLRGTGTITGNGQVPVQSGTLTTGFQVGCKTDVSSGLTAGISGGPNVGLNVSWPPAITVGATVQPSVSATLRPGTIADISFGTKKLQSATAAINASNVHVHIDGCLGPVTLRAYTTVAVSTPTNDDTVTAYGQPHRL